MIPRHLGKQQPHPAPIRDPGEDQPCPDKSAEQKPERVHPGPQQHSQQNHGPRADPDLPLDGDHPLPTHHGETGSLPGLCPALHHQTVRDAFGMELLCRLPGAVSPGTEKHRRNLGGNSQFRRNFLRLEIIQRIKAGPRRMHRPVFRGGTNIDQGQGFALGTPPFGLHRTDKVNFHYRILEEFPWPGNPSWINFSVLLAFHKPFGVLSRFTPDGSPNRTLADFGFPKKVYPLGRLDADSEGLLLLSDEPGLNTRLLDPQESHPRTYWAQVERIPSDEALQKLSRGVTVAGRTTLPCRAWRLDPQPTLAPRDPPIRYRKNVPDCWIGLELTEGKNRQVRRMTAAIGHPTLRLIRIRISGLELADLSSGVWREISPAERQALGIG